MTTQFNKPWTHVRKDRIPPHVPIVKDTYQYIRYCKACRKIVASDMGNVVRPYEPTADGKYICLKCKEARGVQNGRDRDSIT